MGERLVEARERYREHAFRAVLVDIEAPGSGLGFPATHQFANHALGVLVNSHSARAVVDFVKKVDREIKMATNNTIDLKILFAAGIIAFTVFEVGATAATPVWVTLAIFTVNHFIEMHERQLHKESLSGAPSLAPIRVAN
jgi:hypothetical protein